MATSFSIGRAMGGAQHSFRADGGEDGAQKQPDQPPEEPGPEDRPVQPSVPDPAEIGEDG